jgi:hypothetical protein
VINNESGASFAVQSNVPGFAIPIDTGDSSAVAFNNAGTFSCSTASNVAINIPFSNSGTVNLSRGSLGFNSATNSGTVAVASGAALGIGTYTQTAGATILNGGTINGGSLGINGGVLTGTGTINANVTNGGQVSPGGTGAAGLLTINGNYTQTSTGALDIDLGGTTAGSNDLLAVSGAATLGGTLSVATMGSFAPAFGNTFQVMTFGSSPSGNFNAYNGPSMASGLFVDPVFSGTSLSLDIDRVAISGTPAFPLQGIPISLTGAITGPSSGNSFTYSWIVTQNGNPFGSGSRTTFTLTPNLNATYVVTLTVTDVIGGKGTIALPIVVAPSIFVINPTASGALSVSGNANISIPGEIVVDSSSSAAISARGNAQIAATVIDVLGGFQKTGSATISPAPTTGVSVADPLAALTPPSPAGLTNYGSVSFTDGSHTINPGIYSQIKVSGDASLTLSAGTEGNPGIYIIEGGGLTVTGNASLSGQNVLIYNTGSDYPNSGGNFGGITLSGNGTFSLTAPTSGPYAGVAIFQSRANTRALSFSGNAMSGISGIIYAPTALLSFSGNSQLQSPLDVGMLNLSGNVALTQTAAGSDGSGGTSGIANTLLAGDLSVYISDPSGLFTTDELSRIQDAINGWNAILAPYNVTITKVSDPTVANMVIDTGTTSACGGVSNGVLGCFNAPNSEITLIQGWNWYAGSDATQLGSGQYDFETTVLHELGHALGLGGSTNSSSPMYETLASGVAYRTVSAQDLNISEPSSGADPQMAAGFRFNATASVFAHSVIASPNSGSSLSPVGLMPLVSSPWSVVPGHSSLVIGDWSVVGGLSGLQAGQEPSLVVQGIGHDSEAGLIHWVCSKSTDRLPPLDLAPESEPAEPSASPAADPPAGQEHPVKIDGTGRNDEPFAIPIRGQANPVGESVLEELDADPVLWREQQAARIRATDFQSMPEMSTGEMVVPVSRPYATDRASSTSSRLAVALLAGGFWGYRALIRDVTKRQPGRPRHATNSRRSRAT